MKMNRTHLLIAIISFFILSTIASFSAEKDKVFQIIDSRNDKPLPAATVKLHVIEGKEKDQKKLIHADKDGKFVFPFKNKARAIITYIGYSKLIVNLDKNSEEIIRLDPSSIVTEEIVVTGQYLPGSQQKSVFPVKVINAERIEAQTATNLQDLLNNEAGIRIQNDGILGTSMSINGIDGQNVKVMVDGVPVIGRLNGNVDLSQLNLNNAERVEIVEGPMSTVYGSDASGGVINIITKNPVGDKLEAVFNSYTESVGKVNLDGQVRYSKGKSHMMLSGGRNFFGGYSQVDDSRNKQWKPKIQYFADWQYIREVADLRFRYTGNYFNEFILNRGKPLPIYYEEAYDDKYYTDRVVNSLFVNGKLADDQYIDFTTSYSWYKRQKNSYFKDLVTLEEKLTKDPTDQDTTSFNTIMIRGSYSYDKVLDYLSFQLGADVNLDQGDGEKIAGNTQKIDDFAAFASLQYKPTERLIIQPALRVISNSKYDAPLVPAMNIRYDFTDHHSMKLAYSRGFRSPTLKELYLYFVDINHNVQGNQNLLAENSHSFNASIDYLVNNEKHALKIQPKFFYNYINDKIDLANLEDDLYTYVNIGEYETIGGDLVMSYYRPEMTLQLGYTLVGRSTQINEFDEAPTFAFSSDFQASFIWNIDKIDSKFSLFYKFTGEQPSYVIQSIDEQEVLVKYTRKSYNMVDLSFSRDFYDKYLNVAIGVKNLFDVTDILPTSTGGAHTGGSYPISYGRIGFLKLVVKI
jgi:outer membrane receptor for ferrienterochelin and colicins